MSSVLSAHARYREALEGLTDPAVVNGWTRLHERFEPDREPYATLVLRRQERVVRMDAFRAELRVSSVPPDPGLPRLGQALAGPGQRTIVRYHPGRRCTIRVRSGGRTRFAKVYSNGAAEHVHADGCELWRVAARGELAFRIARPEGFDPELRAVWQGSLAGEPLTALLQSPALEQVATRLGRAAGSLPCSSLHPRRCRNRGQELARSASRCAELERRVPELGDQARRLLAALETAHATCGRFRPRPIHGALHTSQWLVDGAQLGLLDYDSLALGDPELDAATFLADNDVQNRERVPVDRLNAAFLAGYESTAGPLDPRLLAVYRAHRRLEKALRVARALRPDGDRKAARRLRGALECLEGAA